MEAVKNTKQYVDYQAQKSGGGCGCWAIGCGIVILLFVALCGGGFYAVFYSSAPLKMVERLIEESGEVEIEGLAGNITSGFTIDEIRFKTEDDHWSNLTNIKCKYKSSIFGSDRMIIEDISIDGGTIYAKFDSSRSEISMNPDFSAEFDEAREEIESEFSNADLSNIKEVRIDLIRVANLKIVNPDTEETISLDEIKYDGFHFEDGELTSLGNLTVDSSQMQIRTTESKHFAEFKNAKRFVGQVNATMDRRLIKDVPLEIEVAFDDDGSMQYFSRLFDDTVIADQVGGESQMTINNFSPEEYFSAERIGVMPSNINVTYPTDKNSLPTDINKDGSFHLGKTQFTNLLLEPQSQPDRAFVIAEGTVDGAVVKAKVEISQREPWGRIVLSSDSEMIPHELWAMTVFGESFADLDKSRKQTINRTILTNSKSRISNPQKSIDDDKTSEQSSDSKAKDSEEELEPLLPIK